MIFWILTVVAIAIVVGAFWITIAEEGLFGIIVGFLISLLVGLLWVLIVGFGVGAGLPHLVGANTVTTEHTQLRAIASDSSVHGRSYFLGGGWVDGKRVLSYISTNEDGSFTTGQVDGSASRIYEEDDVRPSMTTHRHVADHWWLAPPIEIGKTYDFTIPTGSVAEEYEVTP